MEASSFFFFFVIRQKFSDLEKATPPHFNEGEPQQRCSNDWIVYNIIPPPPTGHSPLCSPQAELLPPQCKGGERKQARLPNANSIMTSHGGEREYGAVFEVARLQEALQLQPRYRKLLHRFYRALDLNRLNAACTHCSTHSLHRLRLY